MRAWMRASERESKLLIARTCKIICNICWHRVGPKYPKFPLLILYHRDQGPTSEKGNLSNHDILCMHAMQIQDVPSVSVFGMLQKVLLGPDGGTPPDML